MGSALIISSTRQGQEYFQKILAEDRFGEIVTVSGGGEARRLLIENEFDLCVVNAPLPDENGAALARSIMTERNIQVILAVRAEHFDEISAKVEDAGVFTVAKPINRALLWSILKCCSASLYRMKQMQRENAQLVQKIEDIRMIDRAKCILIEYLKMSEAEAHRYIERQAMDMRLSKRAVAEDILKTYEN